MLKRKIFLCVSLWVIPAFAADLDISNLLGVSDAYVKEIIKIFALGADYKAVHYATPEGLVIGLDAGVEVTLLKPTDDFKAALALLPLVLAALAISDSFILSLRPLRLSFK